MSAPDKGPAPHAAKLSTPRAFFMLFAGPLAWLMQLCVSVALIGWPCFPTTQRYLAPVAHYGWTRGGAAILFFVCLIVALAAGIVSLAKLREVRDEKSGGHAALIEVGHGRTRFTAMWGVVLGFGFAVAIVMTIVPFVMVPRCAG